MQVRASIAAVLVVLVGACAPAGERGGATGSISGVVTSAASGRPLAGVCVSTPTTVGPGGDSGTSARTREDGSYELTGLAPDDYEVRFATCEGSPEAAAGAARFPEYLYDLQGDGHWDPVVVGAGEETRADAALLPGGSISGGVVSRNTAAPLSGVCVSAAREDEDESLAYRYEGGEPVLTDRSGRYELAGLPAATYRVTFGECYFPDEPAVVRIEEYPRLVDVESDRATGGIDAGLSTGRRG